MGTPKIDEDLPNEDKLRARAIIHDYEYNLKYGPKVEIDKASLQRKLSGNPMGLMEWLGLVEEKLITGRRSH